jgi:hypothetical protein
VISALAAVYILSVAGAMWAFAGEVNDTRVLVLVLLPVVNSILVVTMLVCLAVDAVRRRRG